jgi:hypothetical protein
MNLRPIVAEIIIAINNRYFNPADSPKNSMPIKLIHPPSKSSYVKGCSNLFVVFVEIVRLHYREVLLE